MPKELIVELHDEDTFYDEVAPRDLIAAVMGNATPDTTLESMELIKLRDAPLRSVTEEKISLQLKKRAKHIKDLLSVHGIDTSEPELMAKWLRSIQEDGGGDFEDEAVAWKENTTHNTFDGFKQFFIGRNLVMRDQDKHKKTQEELAAQETFAAELLNDLRTLRVPPGATARRGKNATTYFHPPTKGRDSRFCFFAPPRGVRGPLGRVGGEPCFPRGGAR